MGFSCFKATEPLQGSTTKVPEISPIHLIDLGGIKGWVDLGATLLVFLDPWWIGITEQNISSCLKVYITLVKK